MVSFIDFFSKSMSDELMVSRGVPGPSFAFGIDCWGRHFEQNDQNLHENYKLNIFGAKYWVTRGNKLIFQIAFQWRIPQVTSFRGNYSPQ